MRAVVARVVGSALIVAAAACSLVVERGATQCRTDAECAALGGPLAGRTCSPEGVCVAKADVDAGPHEGGALPACTSNRQCIDAAGGAPSICRRDVGRCVAVLSPDCPTVASATATGQALDGASAVRDDDTVLLGALLSLEGTNGPKNVARVHAMELAVAEVMSRAAGLPPVKGGTGRRPVAVVACNDTDPTATSSAPAVARASAHLLALGVPAVVGGGTSGATISAIPLLPKRGVLLVSPSATAPALTSVDDDGLFFRTAPSDALQAIPLAARLQALAPDDGARRVAVLYKSDAYGTSLFANVMARVRLRGRSLADPVNRDVALLRQYDGAVSDQRELVAVVRRFSPDVVLVVGTNEGVTSIVEPLERAWGVDAAAPPRPVYVVSDGLKSSALTEAVARDEAQGDSGLRARVSGTAPGRPTATTEGFVARYEPRYGADNSRTFGTAGAYDATYVILYALGAALDAPPTGANLAAGVARLVGGAPLAVGPDGVGEAFRRLAAGESLDLDGASSPLDFDAAGESPADIEVWCVSPSLPAPTFVTTALHYDAQRDEMRGAFDCR